MRVVPAKEERGMISLYFKKISAVTSLATWWVNSPLHPKTCSIAKMKSYRRPGIYLFMLSICAKVVGRDPEYVEQSLGFKILGVAAVVVVLVFAFI